MSHDTMSYTVYVDFKSRLLPVVITPDFSLCYVIVDWSSNIIKGTFYTVVVVTMWCTLEDMIEQRNLNFETQAF